MDALPIEQRREILNREVASFVRRGYRVISQSDTTAQLVKPKRFGCGWAIVALFTVGLALILYLMQKEQSIYLEVLPNGKVKRTHKKQ